MKHTIFRSFLAVALLVLCSATFSAKAQNSSTEGREFWIALTKANGAEGTDKYFPYIAVSAKEACSFTISNPNTGWSIGPIEVGANSFTQINSVNGNGNGRNEIPKTQWVDLSLTNTQTAQNLGLVLTSTKNVSVYVASRMEYSFDASNILPITALTGDYIIQDYPGYDHGGKANEATFVIVATEDNTQVTIVPKIKTRTGSPAGSPIKVTLKRGEVYHVASENEAGSTFSGTTINANKKIAVFAGDVNTDVPGPKSARDCLYEQAMPTAFWGTEFIVSRSMGKDADRVRITAQNDHTDIYIDGILYKTLNARETFEVELSEGDLPANVMPSEGNGTPYEALLSGTDAHFIQTTCPVAVYLYLVSSGYKLKESEEIGDPSMIWISPLEQMIKQITFGVFATDKTTEHCVNIITETSNVSTMQLLDKDGKNLLTESDFQPVLANPSYSYARKVIYQSIKANPISATFTLKGHKGFIAHVYGNGDDESYGYSVGSSTVERSVQIDGTKLGNGDSLVICLGQPIEFATNFTSFSVDQITWDMGDGVTKTFFDDATYLYTYDSKGWKDIIVTYSLTNSCTGEVVTNESMTVMLYANIPDTIKKNYFLCEGESLNGVTYDKEGQYIDTAYFDCDYVEIQNVLVGAPSDEVVHETAFDSLYVQGDEDNPAQYVYESTTLTRKYTNFTGCDSIVEMNIEILHCLDLELSAPAEMCGGDTLVIAYRVLKGDLPTRGTFTAGSKTYNVRIDQESESTGSFVIIGVAPGRYPNAVLKFNDETCSRTAEFDVPLVVNFPSDIVRQKWNNVLAVLNDKKNGGYEFTAFQWYKNDEPLEGENSSIYYVGTDAELDFTASYYVQLTTTSGVTLISCPMSPFDKYAEEEFTVEYDEDAANVSVSPTVVSPNETINIISDLAGRAVMYSTSGICETQRDVNTSASFRAPARTGIYVIQVTLENGKTRSFHIMVK